MTVLDDPNVETSQAIAWLLSGFAGVHVALAEFGLFDVLAEFPGVAPIAAGVIGVAGAATLADNLGLADPWGDS